MTSKLKKFNSTATDIKQGSTISKWKKNTDIHCKTSNCHPMKIGDFIVKWEVNINFKNIEA